MATYINIPYGYTIQTWDSGSKTISVCDAGGERIEFDCEDGNIFISGSYDEIEPMRMTLPECLEATKEFFIDWNIEEAVADSIIERLTEWFAEYCISEEEAIRDEIAELKLRVHNRESDIRKHEKEVASYLKDIEDIRDLINGHCERIDELRMAIADMKRQIRDLNEELKGGAK